MPFTLAHPVVVVPLHRLLRRRLPLSALAIGSMAPDVEYMLRGGHGSIGHTPEGLVLFALPVGLAIFIIFQYLVKESAIRLLPERVTARLAAVARPVRLFDLRMLAAVALAIVIGAATHLFLDAFTHYDGWFVQRSVFLRSVAIEAGPLQLTWYKLLQYVSAPIGCGLLLAWTIGWFRSARIPVGRVMRPLPLRRRVAIIGAIALVTLAPALVMLLRLLARTDAPLYAQVALVRSAITAMSALAIALIAYGIVDRIFGAALRGRSHTAAPEVARSASPATLGIEPD